MACSILSALAFVAACSDDRTPITPETSVLADASYEAGVEADAGADGSEGTEPRCTTLDPPTELVEPTVVGGGVPEYTGGTVAPGTYLLAKIEVYDGAAPGSKKSGIYKVGADGTIEAAEDVDGTVTKNSGTLTSQGNVWSWMLACPDEFVAAFMYTAAETEVRIGQRDGKRVQVWTKQ